MDSQERIALALLAGMILLLAGMHLVLSAIDPSSFAKPYTPDAHEGDLVLLTGVVDELQHTKSGGHIILIVDGVLVFLPSYSVPDRLPGPGDPVAITGTVQFYNGKQEVVVDDSSAVRILPKKE